MLTLKIVWSILFFEEMIKTAEAGEGAIIHHQVVEK